MSSESNTNNLDVQVGGKVKFLNDRCKYTVQARSERYIICTRKFIKTVMYTIVDLQEQIRGTDNLVFGMGYESKEDCEDNLKRLVDGEMEVSHRNRVKLDVEEVFNSVD
jgi:hypothetical protein